MCASIREKKNISYGKVPVASCVQPISLLIACISPQNRPDVGLLGNNTWDLFQNLSRRLATYGLHR